MQESNKHWWVILSIVGGIIATLLAVIVWKLFPTTMDKQATSFAVTPALSKDAPTDLIITYYQAIETGKVDQVKAAWTDPNSRQARYAVQAIQDFPDARCHPQKVEKTSPKSTSDASIRVVLECKNSTVIKPYSVVFQLKRSPSGQWKILKLQQPDAP